MRALVAWLWGAGFGGQCPGGRATLLPGERGRWAKQAGRNVFTTAVATVTIVDTNGPVEGATVSGYWSELTNDADSGVTDANGVVILKSDAVKNASGRFTFTVYSVTKGEIMYEPIGETSDYIDVG